MNIFIKIVDNLLLKGLLQEGSVARFERKFQEQIGCPRGHTSIWHSKLNSNPDIASLCDKYGSDKGSLETVGRHYNWSPHSYSEIYTILFEPRKNLVTRVFECGLGTNFGDTPSNMSLNGKPGASLRVWRDYFPNALIIGADIDKRVLFSEDRIATFYVDQTDPLSVQSLWNDVNLDDFDIMIDDGLHTFEAGICLLENSFSRLAANGVYIIEDVLKNDAPKYRQWLDSKGYNHDLILLYRNRFDLLGDNILILIRKA